MPRQPGVTLADLVVLSMLTETPMHGYELWAELERRQVSKWASITKTQVYYSLRKLEAAAGRRFAFGAVLYDHDQVIGFGDRLAAVPLSSLWG